MPSATRSEAERLLLRLMGASGLPKPLANVRVAGLEVDFCWPQQRLVAGVDGYAFHGNRTAFERDPGRGLTLYAAGYGDPDSRDPARPRH